jgi:hypothetical protein
LRSGTSGRRKKNAAGKNAIEKRKAANNKGGKCDNAFLMTTKLLPHTATTNSASKK